MSSPMAKKIIILIAAGACLAGGVALYVGTLRPRPSPPVVARAEVEPAVWAAIENARQAVQASPRSAQAWGMLGMVLLAHRFSAEAVICFTEAEKCDGLDLRWPYYLGTAHAATDTEAAIHDWQRAIELSGPSMDAPRLRLAEALQAEGRDEEAWPHYEKLLERQPDHPVAHLGLARSSLAMGRDQDCLRHLAFGLASSCTRKTAYSLQASVHERLGEHKSAEEDARNAAQLPADGSWSNPFAAELARLRVDRQSRLTKAAQWIERERRDEGLAILNDLVQEEPEFEQAWLALGYAYLQLGDYVRAEQALQAALRLAPDAADGHYYRGCVAYNQGKIATAEACFRRAVECKRDYALAHYQIGLCRERQDDPAGAIAALQEAIVCRPNLPEAHRALAGLLIRAGRQEEARSQLRWTLELKPDDQAARQLLNGLKPATK